MSSSFLGAIIGAVIGAIKGSMFFLPMLGGYEINNPFKPPSESEEEQDRI